MLNKFDAKPAVGYVGPIENWTDSIVDVILLNVMEVNYRMTQENKENVIKQINLYGHRKDLNLVKLKKFMYAGVGHIEGITNIKKKIVSDSISNKILLEIIFECREDKWLNDIDYSRKNSTIKETTIQFEMKIENNNYKL